MVNKRREKNRIKGTEQIIIKQLVKCLVYQDNLGTLKKWKSDLYQTFSYVRYLKPFKKFPTEKQLKKWTIKSLEKDLENRIYTIILNLKLDDYPRIYVDDYDIDKIKELIIEYYIWLIKEFTNINSKGTFYIKELSQEVDFLIDRYEKEKKLKTMNKEEVLYHHIKRIFIEEQIKKDYEEKTKYAKEIIKKCKEEYGFESETVVPIFQRIYYSTERQSRLNKYNREYMLGMASVWNRNNIKTKEDVKEFYKTLEDEIVNIIGIDLTTYEKLEIEKLIYYYKVDKNKIVSKIKEKGELNINKLKEELIKITF